MLFARSTSCATRAGQLARATTHRAARRSCLALISPRRGDDSRIKSPRDAARPPTAEESFARTGDDVRSARPDHLVSRCSACMIPQSNVGALRAECRRVRARQHCVIRGDRGRLEQSFSCDGEEDESSITVASVPGSWWRANWRGSQAHIGTLACAAQSSTSSRRASPDIGDDSRALGIAELAQAA